MALPRHVLKELAERRCHVRVPRVITAQERRQATRTLQTLSALAGMGMASAITPAPRHDFTPKRILIEQEAAEIIVPGFMRHVTR